MGKFDFWIARKYDGSGHFQLNYFSKNLNGQRLRYCLQLPFRNGKARLMRCSYDWEVDFEPSHEVRTKPGLKFERPEGNSELELACKEWIDTYEASSPEGA